MPWRSWFEEDGIGRGNLIATDMPLTMVTLRGKPEVNPAEYAFYADAELRVLRDWADQGLLLLAFPSIELHELTLICNDMLPGMRERVATLPLVNAKLVTAEIHSVLSLRLAPSLEVNTGH